ncbi:dcp1 related [Schistosoma mansoni]|uniref:dcp1 related n=1 Tax=Schistosoma mansoni TaxID=6183 RepID=UPI0001A61E01|nr:dcp1 related [Schistosoma mansoni]|eukprot:XP_018648012.1 dcp1 related [Schistosoma mansoni]
MKEEDELNLTVIQTYDKYCTQILDKSPSAHVYSFQSDKNAWAKTKTGGIFFLYKRSKVPFFAFMILNRKSPTLNQIELVTASLQLQLHCPFLLYKTSKGDIFSIWFFSGSDCERIAEKLGKLVHDAGGLGLKIAPTNQSTNSKSKSSNSVMNSMVVAPKSPETVTKGLNQLMDFVRASNENSKSNSSNPSKVNDNVSNHFEGPSIFDMLHKAEADFNSGVVITSFTCFQIFIPTCFRSSRKNKPSFGSSQIVNHISVAELEEQLLQEHISLPEKVDGPKSHSKVSGELKTVVATDDSSPDDQVLSHVSAMESPACYPQGHKDTRVDRNRRLLSDDAGYVDDVDDEEACENRSGRGLPKSYGVGQRKQRRHIRQQHDNLSDEIHSPSNRSVNRNKPSNITPKCKTIIGEDTLVTPDMLTGIPSSIFPGLMSEFNYDRHTVSSPFSENKASISSTEKSATSEYLSKDQLRETLIHLLQTDDDFVHRIHTGYVNVLEKRLPKK